uniref:cell division protein n=1 Tax=Gormaniella terricola TaxID=2904618 RepID=UPI0021CCFB57|nr:cell division protein [Gormaniella terricola]UWV18289.1 cell division protein [Gormaniella terricola]
MPNTLKRKKNMSNFQRILLDKKLKQKAINFSLRVHNHLNRTGTHQVFLKKNLSNYNSLLQKKENFKENTKQCAALPPKALLFMKKEKNSSFDSKEKLKSNFFIHTSGKSLFQLIRRKTFFLSKGELASSISKAPNSQCFLFFQKSSSFKFRKNTCRQLSISPDWHFKESFYTNDTSFSLSFKKRNEKKTFLQNPENTSFDSLNLKKKKEKKGSDFLVKIKEVETKRKPFGFFSFAGGHFKTKKALNATLFKRKQSLLSFSGLMIFSHRKTWWSRLPSSFLLLRLRWFNASSNSFLNLENSRKNLPEWLTEKNISWYWMLPFFGLLGLTFISSNQKFLNTDFTLNVQKSQSIFEEVKEKHQTSFFGPSNITKARGTLFIENAFSWETLYYLDYKKSLFDKTLKNIKNVNYYHDTIRQTLESKWANRLFHFEEYYCTISDKMTEKTEKAPFFETHFLEASLQKLLKFQNLDKENVLNTAPVFDFEKSSLIREEEDWWNVFLKERTFFSWYWHNFKSEPLFSFLNTEIHKEKGWLFMDEFAQKMLPTSFFSLKKEKSPNLEKRLQNLLDKKRNKNKNKENDFFFSFEKKKKFFSPLFSSLPFVKKEKSSFFSSGPKMKEGMNHFQTNPFFSPKGLPQQDKSCNKTLKLTAIYYPGSKAFRKNTPISLENSEREAFFSAEFLNLPFSYSKMAGKEKFLNKERDVLKKNNLNGAQASSHFWGSFSKKIRNSTKNSMLWNEWLTKNSNLSNWIGKEFLEKDWSREKTLNFRKQSPLNSYRKAKFLYEKLHHILYLESGHTILKQKEKQNFKTKRESESFSNKSFLMNKNQTVQTELPTQKKKSKKKEKSPPFFSLNKKSEKRGPLKIQKEVFFLLNKQKLAKKSPILHSGYQLPEYSLSDLVKLKKSLSSSFILTGESNLFLNNTETPISQKQKESFLKIEIRIPPSALEIYARSIESSSPFKNETSKRLLRGSAQENQSLFWYEIRKRTERKLALNNPHKDVNRFLGGSLLYLPKNGQYSFSKLLVGRKHLEKKERTALSSSLISKKGNSSFFQKQKTGGNTPIKLAYINNWSLFLNYFQNSYGSTKLLDSFSNFDTFRTKPMKFSLSKFLKNTKFHLNLDENLVFQKWDSKRKKGFFYKKINKMNFVSNKFLQKPTVELLWQLRTKPKIRGFKALEATKYYQSKQASQNTKNKNSLSSSSDFKKNESILNSSTERKKILSILSKRRRYRQVVRFEKLCDWLRETLYFRKMSRKAKISFSKKENINLAQLMKEQTLEKKGSFLKKKRISDFPLLFQKASFLLNKKMSKLVHTQNFRPVLASTLIQKTKLSNRKKETQKTEKNKFFKFANQFFLSNLSLSREERFLSKKKNSSPLLLLLHKKKLINRKEKLLPIQKNQSFKNSFLPLFYSNTNSTSDFLSSLERRKDVSFFFLKERLFPLSLIQKGEDTFFFKSSVLVDYKPITLHPFIKKAKTQKSSSLNLEFLSSFKENTTAVLPGNESYLHFSIEDFSSKRNEIQPSLNFSFSNGFRQNVKHGLESNTEFFTILSLWQKQIKEVNNSVLNSIQNIYSFLFSKKKSSDFLNSSNSSFYISSPISFMNVKNGLKKPPFFLPSEFLKEEYSSFYFSKKESPFSTRNIEVLYSFRSEKIKESAQTLERDLRNETKSRESLFLKWERKKNFRKTVWYPFAETSPLDSRSDWNRSFQKTFLTPLLVQFTHVSNTLTNWRESFGISRDYTLILNYVSFDYLSGIFSKGLKDFSFSQFSFAQNDGHSNANKRGNISPFQKGSFWYELNTKTEKAFLSPSWSLESLEHLKKNHPLAYSQILERNSEKMKKKEEKSFLEENKMNEKQNFLLDSNKNKKNELWVKELLNNFIGLTTNKERPFLRSKKPFNNKNILLAMENSENHMLNGMNFSSLHLNKEEKAESFLESKNERVFIRKKKARILTNGKLLNSPSFLEKSLFSFNNSQILSSKTILEKHFLNRHKKLNLMKRQQKFLKILQLVKKTKVYSLLTKKEKEVLTKPSASKHFLQTSSFDLKSKPHLSLQRKNLKKEVRFRRKAGIVTSRNSTSTPKKRNIPFILTLRNFLSKIPGNISEKNFSNRFLQKAEKSYLDLEKSFLLQPKTQQQSSFHLKKEKNAFFLEKVAKKNFSSHSNMSLLAGASFWVCATLFHIFSLFSLIKIYKASFHFFLKCTFSITTLLFKHFLSFKRTFRRINKYLYENTLGSLVFNFSEFLEIRIKQKTPLFLSLLKKSSFSLTLFLLAKREPFILNKRKREKFSFSKTPFFSNHFQSSFFHQMKAEPFFRFLQRKGKEGNFLFNFLEKKNDTKRKKETIFLLNKIQKQESKETKPVPYFVVNIQSLSDFLKLPVFEMKENTKVFTKEKKKTTSKLNVKFLNKDFFFLIGLGESLLLTELEPYREMHWSFLKKQPFIIRAQNSQNDELNMAEYQADERFRKLKNRLRKAGEILAGRIDKTQKKYKALSESKRNEIKENSFSAQSKKLSLQKESQNQFHFGEGFRSNPEFFQKQEETKKSRSTQKRFRNVRIWKPVFSFFGKACLTSRILKFSSKFRQSLFFFDRPSSVFGPLGTIFLPFLIKEFAITFDTSRQKPLLISLFFKKEKKTGKKVLFKSFFPQNNFLNVQNLPFLQKERKKENSLNNASLIENSELMPPVSKLDSSSGLFSFVGTSFLATRVLYLLSASREVRSSTSKIPLMNRNSLRHFEKLTRKYSLLNLEKTESSSLFLKKNQEIEFSGLDENFFSQIVPNLGKKGLFLKKNTASTINTNFSSLYQINAETSVFNRFLNSETYDPKNRFYRFFTNFNKKLEDVNGLSYDYDVQNQFGPIILKIYTGMFLKQEAKNLLLVGNRGRTNSLHLLVKAMAGETGLKLFVEDAKRLGRVGRRGINNSVKRLEKLFRIAQANVPAIVYLEDIHMIASKRKGAKTNEEYDDQDLAMRFSFSKLIYQKKHSKKSLIHSFIEQNLALAGQAPVRKRSVLPESPIPKNLIGKKFNSSNSLKQNVQKNEFKVSTLINFPKKLTPAFTTNAALIWKMFKQKRNAPHEAIKEDPWIHTPIDAIRSRHPLSYSVKFKVLKLTFLALSTVSTQLRLVKDLIRLFESLKYESYKGFLVLATTNKLSLIDPALRQPGRLEETVFLAPLELAGRIDVLNTSVKNLTGFKQTFNKVNAALMFSLFSNENFMQNGSFSLNGGQEMKSIVAKGQDWEWDYVHSAAKKVYEKTYLENVLNLNSSPLNGTLEKGYKQDLAGQKSGLFMLLNMSNQIFLNLSSRLKKNEFENFRNSPLESKKGGKETRSLEASFQNSTTEKTFLFNRKNESSLSSLKVSSLSSKRDNFNFRNLSVVTACAYGQAGKFILSSVFEKKQNPSKKFLNTYSKTFSKKGEKNKVKTCSLASNFRYDFEMLDGFNLWPFAQSSAETRQRENFIRKPKSLCTLSNMTKVLAPKIGELFLLSLPKRKKPAPSLLLLRGENFYEKEKISNSSLVFGNRQKSSSILSLILTNNFYSKNSFLPRLFRFEDVSNQRKRPFSENLDSSMLFEYFSLNKPFFSKKLDISLEETLQNQQQQKYFLNLENRPLKKNIKLANKNRQAHFHMLFNELGSLNEISSRPTSMNYYYKKKIRFKQQLNKFSNKWWNWHLKKGKEYSDEFQFLYSFPYAEKHYNPRHRRWILTKSFWGYWFTYDKALSYEIYQQWMVLSFNKLSNRLSDYRECLDFLSQHLISKQVLTEVFFLTIIKRFLF